jgi:hypothetical protein
MDCRPQFSTETPSGFQDEEFLCAFDLTFYPLGLGGEMLAVPLPLKTAEEFRIQSLTVIDDTGMLGVRFRDPFGNQLSDDFIPASDYAPQMTLEPELVCQPGATLQIDFKNIG